MGRRAATKAESVSLLRVLTEAEVIDSNAYKFAPKKNWDVHDWCFLSSLFASGMRLWSRLFLPFLFSYLLLITHSLCFEKIMDWSSAILYEDRAFKDINGEVKPLENIFRDNGITMLRQRCFAGKGTYDVDANIHLARRVKASGLKLMLDVFFSHDFTDRGKIQCYPEWGSTVESISKGIYGHFKHVADTFVEQGIIPEIIAVGNEITSGICEMGKMSKPEGPRNTAIFLQSAIDGIHASKMGKRSKLLIHLDHGHDQNTYTYFFDKIRSTGMLDFDSFDKIGMSTYAYHGGKGASLSNIGRSIKIVKKLYGKGVMIVESGYPRQCEKPPLLPNDMADWGFSVRDQAKWIRSLAQTAKKAGAESIAYFEAAWLTNWAAGSPCENVLLFNEHTAQALPSLAAFKDC